MRATCGAWSTPSRGSSRKPSGLSRSTRRRLEAIGPRARLASSARSGSSTRRRAAALRPHLARRRSAPRSSRRSASGSRSRRARGSPAGCSRAGEPAWMADAPEDGNFPRADAARRSGLHAGVRVPAAQPARRRRRDGVLLGRAARARRAAARDDGARSAASSASSSRAGGPRRRSARASRDCGRCSRRRSTPS